MSRSIDSDSSFTVENLLLELSQLQSKGTSCYARGLFASQRYHTIMPYEREDNNLFFTVSVVHILQGMLEKMTESEAKLAKEIIAEAHQPIQLFKNKDGLDTYNFWQTRPSRHFPNGWFMHRFKHFQIPDDVDDTALVYFIEDASKERVAQLRERLKAHANLAYKHAYNPLPQYHGLKCYSTFFGKQMYIEFDICVLSNLMRLILTHFSDDLNDYDRGTLDFITEVILNDQHVHLPFHSAPNYPTTELILYHVSRLIPLLPEDRAAIIKDRIVQNLCLKLSMKQGLDKVMLESAMLKLTGKLPEITDRGMLLELGGYMPPQLFGLRELMNDRQFYFFHAGMITAFENRLAQSFADRPFFHLCYTSKALNGALLLENMLLNRTIQA